MGLGRGNACFLKKIEANAFEEPLFAAMTEIALLDHGGKIEALPLGGIFLAYDGHGAGGTRHVARAR